MFLLKLLLIATLLATCVYCYKSMHGPLYPPTKGSVWPRPQIQIKSDEILTVNVGDFVFIFPKRYSKMFLLKLLLIATLLATCVYCYKSMHGPLYPPTKGSVWPRPQIQIKSDQIFTVNVGDFKFIESKAVTRAWPVGRPTWEPRLEPYETIPAWNKYKRCSLSDANHTCNILSKAISRYEKLLHNMKRSPPNPDESGILNSTKTQASVTLLTPCNDDEMPYFGMVEEYKLIVADEIHISSHSVWGIMRAMESFIQLIYTDKPRSCHFNINHTTISDWPTYPHRGLLIDTSRHFISVPNILRTLDAMELNKMNVLHWHIVDTQSFPYQSEVLPKLSAMGAYQDSMIYSRDNIEEIIEFARDRGIRVIPEFDVPDHTLSWGQAYPDILTKCYKNNEPVSLGAMNPIHTNTYTLLKQLFDEVQEWFPDKYLHIGGDEVDTSCWASNPELREYMKKTKMSSVSGFMSLFMTRAISLLKNDTIPIVWEEAFKMVPQKKALIQVWKYFPISTMKKILKSGHQVLFSSDWYLDYYLNDWTQFYVVDPRSLIRDKKLAQGVVGGEASMWGEKVDDSNIISRVWPRASAVAERLWSGVAPDENWNISWSQLGPSGKPPKQNKTIEYQLELVRYRLEEHTCRMIKRGIAAEPASGPGFCLV